MACPRMHACPMYELFNMKELLGFWKRKFCEKDYDACKRYELFKEGQEVPKNLLPNGDTLNIRE